ncbi:MAG: PAS domain-containing protein [Planctomycetota bacterium]|jgi:PAS domain S-box-containing protein
MEETSNKSKSIIGKRKHLEDELRVCKAKLKILLENVSSGIAIYEARNDGRDFVFKDFNCAAEQIEKIKKEEVIGKSILEAFPGVKDFGLFDVLQRVWKTGTPEHLPVSTYRDERIAGWRENYVFKLPSGEVVAVYDDVTEHKHSELAIRMSEQCFRAIADYTYSWEVWVNPDGRPMWTNPAAERVSGYTVKEVMAMADYPMPFVHEQDKAKIGRAFKSALRGSTGNDVGFRIRRKDGNIVWAEISWQPIYDDRGICLGHRQSIRDVTAQKAAEEALRKAEQEKEQILDSLAELVVYEDRELRILWANRAAYESVGMTREELIGRRCYEFWGEGNKPCKQCAVLKAMETGRMHEIERVSPDGRAWLVQGSPVRNEEGDIIGATDIALDITARKSAEEALRKSEEKYRELAEGKSKS